MQRNKFISLLVVIFLLLPCFTWAAPATAATAILKVRSHQDNEKLRIVLDCNSLSAYNITRDKDALQLVVEIAGAVNKSGAGQMLFNNPLVSALRFYDSGKGSLMAVLDLKQQVMHKTFTLSNPTRLVIDIYQSPDQEVTTAVIPGLTYTWMIRGQAAGTVKAHVLEIDPEAGFALQPVLSNGTVNGLDTVSAMAAQAQAVAAVNGSYFADNGEIIGLMKWKDRLISTPTIDRTAVGILPDHTLLLDQVAYNGSVTLPNGKQVTVTGVNRQRGPNELLVYNSYYGMSTGTNSYGSEYMVKEGKVTAVGRGNTALSPDIIVLSAHGEAAKDLAKLKVGDTVKISHTLGSDWDKTVHALGAGPTLIKNSSIFLTTTMEDFGSDVACGQAPRTALGITKQGHILLVVVDGRQPDSAGMTLLELALFLQELGAVNAMNLDGGGSSTMVINGKVVNKPSDGRERKVGNALAVISTRLAN